MVCITKHIFTCDVKVRVYKKCAFEKPPSLKTRANHDCDTGHVSGINVSREFFLVGDAARGEGAEDEVSEPVPPEELMRAYRCRKEGEGIASSSIPHEISDLGRGQHTVKNLLVMLSLHGFPLVWRSI